MGLSEETRQDIRAYLLEKIDLRQDAVAQRAVEAFGITPKTAYRYLKELEQGGQIVKLRRDAYALVTAEERMSFHRSAGELVSEDEICGRVMAKMGLLAENVARCWTYMLSEMVNNVIDHSGAETLDVILRTDARKHAVILADDGVGIFEKIAAYLGITNLDEAVSELFKGKLTTDPLHHSGEGIFFTSRMADTFAIASSGKVFAHDRFDAEILRDIPAGRGTVLYMALSKTSKRNAKDVFDGFADPDGGFTRTRIPLNRYFDSAPVSRSQAKRLCEGLNRYRDVELDFRGVDWTGQGFAHQIFVVFPRENPDTAVTALNATPDVQRMLRHVMGEAAE